MGENFRFGAKAKGDPEMLGGREEFETRVVPLVEVDGETVSSTRVRALVAAGEVDAAMRCLGAPFMLEGKVVEGDQRGKGSSASRLRTWSPTTGWSFRATASTRRSPTATRRRSTSGSVPPSRPAAAC